MPNSTRFGLGLAVGLALSGLLVIGLVVGAGMPVVTGLVLLFVLDVTLIASGYIVVRKVTRLER